MTEQPFWERKTLSEMTAEEWEALCDGCGRCCVHKLQDVDTGVLVFTNVACRALDHDTGRCTVYEERQQRIADCLVLAHDSPWLRYLPSTCAYRLLGEGQPLPEWHPLVSGDPDSVREAGISVRGRVVSEAKVHPSRLEEHVVTWID